MDLSEGAVKKQFFSQPCFIGDKENCFRIKELSHNRRFWVARSCTWVQREAKFFDRYRALNSEIGMKIQISTLIFQLKVYQDLKFKLKKRRFPLKSGNPP